MPNGNPYDALIEDDLQRRQGQLAGSLSTAADTNPDAFSASRRVAKYLGYPTAAVEALPKDTQRQATIKQVTDATVNSPVLQNKYLEPDFARLAHDDAPKLTEIEQAVRKYGELKAWKGPEPTAGSVLSGLADSLPQGVRAMREGLRMQMGDLFDTLGILPRTEQEKAEAARRNAQAQAASAYTTPEFQTSTASAVYGGLASTLRQVPGIALSIATGNPTAALASIGVQTQTEAYGKYRARGATPGEAFVGGAAEGAIEVGTELLPMSFLVNKLGKTGMTEFFTGLLARELPSEQVATLLQDAVDTAIANPDKTWAQYMAERPEAAYQTLVATVTQSAVMAGANAAARRAFRDTNQINDAEGDAQRLTELFMKAGESKLRERDPQSFAELVQGVADQTDGAPKSVFMDAAVLAQTLQQSGMTDVQIEEMLPGVTGQLPEAMASGGTVELPIGDLVARVAGTPLEQVFLQNLRTAPDALSQLEAQEAAGQAEAYLQTEAERVIAEATDADTMRASAEVVKATVLGQLNATKRFRPDVNETYATLAGAFYTTMAGRLGITPQEMFARYPLRITSDLGEGNVLDQALPGEISVEGYHFSMADRPTLSTGYFGTGLKGSARDEILANPDKRLGQRLSFYFDKGTGIRPESGVGGRAHRVQLTGVYDADADPLKLKTGDARAFETKLLDLGYRGYANRLEGTQPGQVIMLGKQDFKPELLGAQSRIEAGQKLPALPRAEPQWQTQAGGTPEMLQAKMQRMLANPSWAGYDIRIEGGKLQTRQKVEVFEQLTTGFEAFVGDAARVDLGDAHEFAAGEPVVVAALHGTTGDFTTFDAAMANIESDLGGGFYFTNNPADVGENYAGMGPDLTNKIQGEAERLESNDDLDLDEAQRIARDKWMANEGLTMPVWVKMTNPAVLGGSRETFLTYDESYDEEAEEYGEPTGTLIDVIEALREVAQDERYGDANIEQTISEIMESAVENGGISARDLIATAKLSEGLVYAVDYESDGKLAPQEILRKAFEAAGFDGFIDQTVDEKFGSASEGQRKYGKGMKGMDADTVHFIAFKPAQIKSRLGNNGNFDSSKSSILEQQAGGFGGRNNQAGNRGRGYSSGGLAPLAGAPAIAGASGPDPRLVAVAEQYARDNGIDLRRQAAYVEVDPERAARIAEAYEAMPHAPQDPAVREAYQNLIQQTVGQYTALQAAGYKFWFMDPGSDPYQGNPWNAMRDLRANQSMAVFPTEAGFGTGGQVNIGLADPNGGPNLDPKIVLEALKVVGAEVETSAVFSSDTEPTLAVKVKKALTKEQGDFLSKVLDQEAIAQRTDNEKGALFGPKAQEWGPFNPEYFVTPTGARGDAVANPLLADTGIEWAYGSPDGELRPVLANDLFRAVHDAFGHGLEGAGFRAQGEENAFQAHVRLFTGPAVGAITTETRGQNSWLNYGPFGEQNRNAKVEDTVFADQKTGLMPEWTWTEGRADDEGVLNQSATDQTRTPEFKAWFGDSKVVDAEGKPLVVYHGAVSGFTEFDPKKIGERDPGFFGAGFYFAPDEDTAQGYADSAAEADGSTDPGEVIPAYISLQNPFVWDMEAGDGAKATRQALAAMGIERSSVRGDSAALGNTTERRRFQAAMQKLGHDGVVVRDEDGIREVVAFKPEQIKSAIGNRGTFDANDPNILNQPARGTFNPSTLEISLLQDADLSTFQHELGHFFLEVQADIASQPGAPAQVVADMEATLKWFGVKADKETGRTAAQMWLGMSLEEKRPYHERWAESFEQYLFEGKAPSVELRGAFQRFRQFMISVYKSLKAFAQGRNLRISAEVRGVFDRLIATDEQIAEAESLANFEGVFKSAKEAGMTPEEWAAYQAQNAEATTDATEELQKRSLADMKWAAAARGRALRRAQADVKEKRDAMRAEVAAEVEAMPVEQARAYIKELRTSTPEQRDALKDWGDRREAALERAREEVKAALLATPEATELKGIKKGQFLAKNKKALENQAEAKVIAWEQENPRPTPKLPEPQMETIAEQFGFSSGDELARALVEQPPGATFVDALTEQRLLETYGDLVTADGMARAANEAVHNEARRRFVATELAAMQRAMTATAPTGQTNSKGRALSTNVIVKAAKAFAETVVNRRKVLDLKPAQHAAAATRAAAKALKLQAAGKTEEAIAAKRDQLLSEYTARYSEQARKEIERGLAYLKKFDKDSVRAGLPASYVDQIDQMLERFELKVSTTARELDRRASLAAWVAEQQDLGLDPVVPEDLLANARLTSYKQLTVEEFRALVDGVKSVEHLGRLKSKLLAAKDKREFDIIANEIAASIADNGGKPLPVQLEPDGKIKKFFKGAWADHRKLNSLIRQMDGGKDNGPFYRALVRSMNDAGASEALALEKATEALAKIYAPIEKLSGGFSGAKLFIPEINNSLTRAGRLSIALNWGNPQNRQRVMDGDGWTEAQVNAILATLSPVELQFVNDVWGHIDSYWPEIKAKQERVSGVVEDKVEAVPFEINGVQMRGGYYPIKYDTERSIKAEKQEALETAKQIMQGAVARPTTRRGHTKARVEEVKGRPVRKDLSVVTQHINQVVHDLAWHEWFIDANKLLNDKRIASAIRQYHGTDTARVLKEAADAIAVGDATHQGQIDRLLLTMRSNVSRSIMGASLTTAIMQPFGLTQSMARVGVVPVLKGAARWAGEAARMESTVGWVREKSEFMRLRGKTFNRELREISQRVQGKSKIAQVYDASLFMLMAKLQTVADIPTWVGAYEKALAGGVDESTAVALADEAVLGSQGGGTTKDLAAVQRNMPFLTQFYSYFNTTLNLVAEKTAATEFRDPKAVAGWMADMALLTVIPAILPALLTHLLKGGGEDDDAEKWAKRVLEWQAGYLFGMFVLARELPTIWSPFDYAGPPAGKVLGDLKKATTQAGQGEIDEPAVLATINLLGTALGLPTIQATRSYKGWKAWSEGDAPATAILFGPPPRD